MPGVTFTLSEFPFEWIELACGASGAGDYERRGLWSGTGLTMAQTRSRTAPSSAIGTTPAAPTTSG